MTPRKRKLAKPKVWIGYLCRISLDHEVGFDRGGTRIYWSKRDWAHGELCSPECTVARVEIREVPRKKRRTTK